MRHYPAFDWLMGFSKYVDTVQEWWHKNLGPDWRQLRDTMVEILTREAELMEIVRILGTEALSEYEKHILGGECNVWTERIPQNKVDYMVFPRILAMSENLWSAREKDSFAGFLKRVDARYPALKNMGVAYGPEAGPVRIKPELEKDKPILLLNLTSVYDDLEIYYSISGQKP